jgi:IMP dehydrogenase
MNKAYTYDDVLLIPQYSDIRTRSEVDISGRLGDISLDIPVISSPMDTVTEASMATAMRTSGCIGVIHRYNSIPDQCDMVFAARPNVGAAVGVTGDFLERALALCDAGANFICVDVAHGHHILMKEALGVLRTKLPVGYHIMAGNVATLEGFNDLADWGASSIRCNIGGGSICTTRVQTGHGMPGLQTILECARSDRSAQIIADGGIKNAGDAVKALAAGADFIMLGSLLAGTDEAPGVTFETTAGRKYKQYRGMASKEAQHDWRGRTASMEGVATTVDYKGPVRNILALLQNNIRSGLSYSGARNIRELQAAARFVVQTGASQVESTSHILLR